MSSGSEISRATHFPPGGYPNGQQFPPGMYPPGYNPWIAAPPPMPGPWAHSWAGNQFPPPAQPWVPPTSQPSVPTTENSRGDEYTVDSMRRIYSNEDSSIEIERVKVQRRQQLQPLPSVPVHPALTFPGFPQGFRHPTDMSKSLVPVAGPSVPPQRRPPPRKHRKNKLNNELVQMQMQPNSYPPYYPPPYFPYMPYPYPYPYPYFNYSWPPAESNSWESASDSKQQNERRQTKQQESLPASPDSQRIDSFTTRSIRDSTSPEFGRPFSPAPSSLVSQVTGSQATDIGPSDSASAGGYCKGAKREAFKPPDWMREMQKNLANLDDSSEAGDRESFTTAPSDIPSPPSRRNKFKDVKDKVADFRQEDDNEDKSAANDKSGADLNYAFKKLEKSVDIFKSQVSVEATPSTSQSSLNILHDNSHPTSNVKTTVSNSILNLENKRMNDMERRSSTASFHSVRNTTDDAIVMADTDSTDIVMATDTATADEELVDTGKQRSSASSRQEMVTPLLEEEAELRFGEGHKWVLQGPGEAPDLGLQQGTNTWLAEVSLWRARLVVSLDRGQGLDNQDWATFHLLIQHPLPLHLKLSLLHASRICAANPNIGAVQVRAALLQVARHAQVLLQKEEDRPSGWKTITAYNSHPWMPVKGGIEILRILGYRNRDDGTLKYSRRLALESTHLARLTLDLLVFADELRLYLTGGHQNPTNISDLFCPVTFSTPASPEPLGMQMNTDLQPSFNSSTDFISAETTPVLERKSTKQTEFNLRDYSDSVHQPSVQVDYNKQLLEHHSSSSEEVTLHEDIGTKEIKIMSCTADKIVENFEGAINQRISVASSVGVHSLVASERLSLSTDITSLPDLQSLSSLPPSRLSNVPISEKQSDSSNFSSPVPTPLPQTDIVENKHKHGNGRKEDHIYEEIGEIKAQVQKLRSCVSVPNLPPPLPPKIRSLNQDDDSSILYSRSDWSATCSMGGSTGRRQKKRRAPLPPSFLYEDQIKEGITISENPSEIVETDNNYTSKTISASSDTWQEPSQSSKSKTDVNPFYEEIGDSRPKLTFETTKEQTNKKINPFQDSKPLPTGYVGANPFYEDISVLKSKISNQISQTDSISDDNTTNLLNSSIEMQFDQSDGNTPPVAAVRPKRKAPKSPAELEKSKTMHSSQRIGETNLKVNEEDDSIDLVLNTPNDLRNGKTIPNSLQRIPSESELHDVDLNSLNEEIVVTTDTDTRHKDLPKNADLKQLRGSQDVVSVKQMKTESRDDKVTAENKGLKSNVTSVEESKPSIITNDNKENIPRDVLYSIADVVELNAPKDKTIESEIVTPVIKVEENTKEDILLNLQVDSLEKQTDDKCDSQTNSFELEKDIADSFQPTILLDTYQEFSNSANNSETRNSDNTDAIEERERIAETKSYSQSRDTFETTNIIAEDTAIDTAMEHKASTTEFLKSQIHHTLADDSEDLKLGSEERSATFNTNASITAENNVLSASEDKTIKTLPLIPAAVIPDIRPLTPPKSVLSHFDEIEYIDNNDVKNYKYATIQPKKYPQKLKRTAISPIQFLENTIPFIDEYNSPPDFDPPRPPSKSPPQSPNNSLPETPHNSPPPTPPPIAIDENNICEELTFDKNRLNNISENGEDDTIKCSKNEEKNELKSPIIFGHPDTDKRKSQRISAGYYEIPELPELPPPLPVKPSNLRNLSLLQRTPDLPPKSLRISSQPSKINKYAFDDGRYEIPEIAKANALTTQLKASTTDIADDISISTASYPDFSTDDSSSPNKPPRRRRPASQSSPPPRPPKTFASQFPGLKAGVPPNSDSSTAALRAATLPVTAKHTASIQEQQQSHHHSTSMPSSPKPVLHPKFQRNSPAKSRTSWPFLFCDCLYANYETNTHTKK